MIANVLNTCVLWVQVYTSQASSIANKSGFLIMMTHGLICKAPKSPDEWNNLKYYCMFIQ